MSVYGYLDDENSEAICPHCFGHWGDLGEYNLGGECEIIECPYCDKPVLLSEHIDISYTTAIPVNPDTEEIR